MNVSTLPMPGLQPAKRLVEEHYAALSRATPQTVTHILRERLASDCRWYGMHPFHEQIGPGAIADVFWIPFLTAFNRVQRREDIFFSGLNEIDGFDGLWTCSMGHLMGLFDRPFLSIPATRKMAFLRYAEFNKIEAGHITQTALSVDLLHLMLQVGLNPLHADQTGQHLVQPGPMTHDGLLRAPQERDETDRTLARINMMIGSITQANGPNLRLPPEEELARDWVDDMIWWGPAGIGASYTIDRYIEQHQGPFRRGLSGRAFNGHVCRMAEGRYGGFFGWPNLTLTNTGGYMGVAANDARADMRVVDIYRREGDRLAENWVFIDMLHFFKMQGVDILAEIAI
ncbi:nuclear transport factor 2 family protein [uncultured Roseobacter sp.]|uniref:nuclear transport factor 2 family protein n=1 Tax=uncultured Roseobacter sp. TaxID=114847 RepID=UPI00261BF475|nr:nuclear transport factor 2 family protein [uncultured Roseobacter sp.]